MTAGRYTHRDVVASIELPDGRTVNPVAFNTDDFLRARIMFTQQLTNGDAFNELASWWRLAQCDVPHPGATWFLLPKWPRPDSISGRPAVVDDFGTLVPVEWRS